MGVKINMSGINVSGDAKVLNDAKFSDKSRVDVEVEKSSINGNAEVLNGLNAGKQSEVDVKIKNTDIDGNARAFNNIDVQDGKVEVEVENLRLGKDVEFMNDKKIQENKEIKEEEKNETATHINGANNKTEISDDKEKIENETEFVQTENYLITEFGNEIKGLKAQKENINVMNENNEKLLKEIKAKEEEMKQIQDSKSVFYQDIYQEYKEKDDKFKVLISKRMSAERMLEKNIEKIKQEKIAKLKEELKSVEENRKSEFVNINSKEAEKLRSEKKELQEQIKLNDITKVEFENMPYEEQGKVRKAKEQILNNKHKLQEIDSKLKIVDLYKGKKPLERYKEINNEIDTINREFTLENLDNLIGKWEAKENKEKLEQTNSIRADLDARTEKAIENSKKRIFEEKSENVSEVETKNYFNGIDKIKKSSIIGIEIKEGSNIINITTKNENGEKQTSKIEKKIETILKNKKTIFAEPEIVEILNNVEPSKFKQFLLKRKLNPVILATLNDNKQSTTILDYVEAIKNKENCENLKIKHDIRHSVLKGNLKRTMKRIAKTENKIDGMQVIGLQESKIAGLLGKKKIKNKPSTIKEGIKLVGKIKAVEAVKNISKKTFKNAIKVKGAVKEGLKKVSETYREGEDLEKLEDKDDPNLEETQYGEEQEK